MIYFLLLLAVTAIWGWTFVVVKDALEHYAALPFLALRFTLAGLVMLAVIRRVPSTRTLKVGAVVGLTLTAGYLFQTVGLKYTSPGNAGLITGLFVVFTPFLDRLFGTPIPLRTGVAVLAALLGTVALSGFGSGRVEPLGDALEVLCAVAFALQIVLLSRWSPTLPAGPLALVQLATAAVVFDLGGIPGFRLPERPDVWIAIAITGLFASSLAFLIQTWAQAHLSASRTALIMATEPAWALAFGVLLAGQRLNAVESAGAGLILVAILGHEVAGVRAARHAVAQ